MSDLLNCPFCGSGDEHLAIEGERTRWVACTVCDTCGPSGDEKMAAIAAWNRRAPAKGEEDRAG